MAFGYSAMQLMAGAAVASTAYSAYSGERSASMQRQALASQEQAQTEAAGKAKRQERLSEQAQNAANRKQPDISAIMKSAQSAQGGTGTMLTGPMGVDPNSLSLGKSTLLGG